MDKRRDDKIDFEIFDGYYVFPGELRVAVEDIERLPQKDFEIIRDVLGGLKDRLLSCFETDVYSVCKIPVSARTSLIACYQNNIIDLYLLDNISNEIFQTLTLKDVDMLVRREQTVLKAVRRYSHRELTSEEIAERELLQRAIGMFRGTSNRTRGSPSMIDSQSAHITKMR